MSLKFHFQESNLQTDIICLQITILPISGIPAGKEMYRRMFESNSKKGWLVNFGNAK